MFFLQYVYSLSPHVTYKHNYELFRDPIQCLYIHGLSLHVTNKYIINYEETSLCFHVFVWFTSDI